MTSYASGTSVAVSRSKAEIEATLQKYGAVRFFSGQEVERAVIGFEMANRRVQFELPLPAKESFRYYRKREGSNYDYERTVAQIERAWDQACRERWRALALAIKAKLVSVECGVESFEEAFLAHVVMPGGKTVGHEVIPRIADTYLTGKLRPLLPG